MIGMELIDGIHPAYFERWAPIEEIVRTLTLSRGTVCQVIPQPDDGVQVSARSATGPQAGERVTVRPEILNREANLHGVSVAMATLV